MFLKIKLFLAAMFLAVVGSQAQPTEAPPNWFNLDAQKEHVAGVSTNEAIQYLAGRPSRTVIVAVIDSGIDIEHEDLRDVIWTNEDEIPDNGIDDDHNGYVDDIHGWNFIGGQDGRNVGPANLEVTREYRRLKPIYENAKPSKKKEYQYWLEIKKGYEEGLAKAKSQFYFYDSLQRAIIRADKLMRAYLDSDSLSSEMLAQVQSPDDQIMMAAALMGNILQMVGDNGVETIVSQLDEAVEHYRIQVEYQYNLDFDPRPIVGDNPDKLDEVGYGNNDVRADDTDNFHGTHVAGIIAAKRDNGIGIDGIAPNVKIMAVRAVPDGDEWDKDVANAIRYAVDNGAQVINMSFGKGYSPHKAYVDAAVKYAAQHGVLLVHAAGNSGQDNDVTNNFPTKKLNKKGPARNWIEVGASTWHADEHLPASFSNYGKSTVDVFAPGVAIYSTAPHNEYRNAQGTSMASPVTAGVAALLLSYFPQLSPTDIHDIMVQATHKYHGLEVIKPGTKDEKVDFGDLSVSGGVVNALEAVKLAESWQIGKKK